MEECNLPEEVVVEILCRLPKKSLARFESVSEKWCDMIRNRVFPKSSHLGLVLQSFRGPIPRYPPFLFPHKWKPMDPSSRVDSLLHVDDNRKGKGNAYLRERSSLINIEEGFVLIDSWNGFLLCCEQTPSQSCEEFCIVYHPATNRSWRILCSMDHSLCLGLAPDDSHAPHDFKLVRIFLKTDGGIGALVFSSHNGGWVKGPRPSSHNEELGEDPPPSSCAPSIIERSVFVRGASHSFIFGNEPIPTTIVKSAFVKGALHWISADDLVIYRLEDGVIKLGNLPPDNHRHENRYIWDSKGYLNYCAVYGANRICIWSSVGGNWNSERKKFSFDWEIKHEGTLAPPFSNAENHIPFVPIGHNDDFHNDDFSIVYLKYDRKIFFYNIATEELNEAYKSPSAESDFWAYPFRFLSQSDIAAAAVSDEGPSRPCSDEKQKRRK